MKRSCFYADALLNPFPVTMLLLEHISVMMLEEYRKEEAGESGKTIQEVIKDSLKVTSVKTKPSRDDILYVYVRMQAMNEENSSQPKDPSNPMNAPAKDTNKKKAFASEYLNWVSKLDHESMCLHAAGYDYEKASHLYTKVDRDAVMKILNQRADSDWHDKLSQFEACLFGFGGGYEKKGSNTFDLMNNAEEAEASIKALKF